MGSGSDRPGLSISVVTYSPDLEVLNRALSSLDQALSCARSEGVIGRVAVFVVDNGPGAEWTSKLRSVAERALRSESGRVEILSGHGNVGYGCGHNLAMANGREHYHLVLNPDVILDSRAIVEAAGFMEKHDDVGLVAPAVRGSDGKTQYLCKRYPSVLDLVLRGFAPPFFARIFRLRLERYEMKSATGQSPHLDVPIASGSFMFLRRSVLNQLGGFSDVFFMYFEDFDLSVRLSKISRIAYVPAVKITHLGGYAATKGWRHVCMFVRSGITFYGRHGWKWW